MQTKDDQATIFGFFEQRHKTTWNILFTAHEELKNEGHKDPWMILYRWENYIIRLYLYRKTCNMLRKITYLKKETNLILKKFDQNFKPQNVDIHQDILTDLRHIFEHFDDIASGGGNNKVISRLAINTHKDFSNDKYNLGHYSLDRDFSFTAATELHEDINKIKKNFYEYYKLEN